MARYHVMTVGDVSTGRTTLNLCYSQDKYSNDVPSHLPDKVFKSIVIEEFVHECCAYEDHLKSGSENIDEERRFSYPSTDAFIVLFDVASKESFENVEKRWIPELRKYCPHVPIVITANKIDLRRMSKHKAISTTEGMQMAKKMGTSYFEVSCLKMEGIEDLFKHAVGLAILNTKEMREKLKLKSVLYPPLKELPDPEPEIEVDASKFTKDWQQMFSDLKFPDVRFFWKGGLTMVAHKVVLCSASPFFKKVFIDNTDESFTTDDLSYGRIHGIEKISEEEGETILELSPSVKSDIFDLLLEFIYTGFLSISSDDFDLSMLKATAEMFDVTQLVSHCDSLFVNQNGNSYGMVKMFDLEKGASMKEFVGEDVFSDISFKIGESDVIPAHKIVVYARCSKMAAVLDERVKNGESLKEIPIPDISVGNFTAFLAYLYTDSPNLENFIRIDLCHLYVLAIEYGANRLATLCEQQLRKCMEESLGDEIDMLILFKLYKVKQMESWVRHYLCHNYAKYSQEKMFLSLDTEDRDYLKKHQHPSESYLKELEEYESKLNPGEKKDCVIL